MNLKNTSLSNIAVPISLGELIEKITILEIKKAHMSDLKLKNVKKELNMLKFILKDKNLKIDLLFFL